MVLSDRGPQFMSIFIEDLNEGIKNQENAIYSISSSNRQIDQINQPRSWNIPETLCQLLAGQLNRLASSSRIPIQKENLTVQIKFPKLENFLIGLQRSWEEATKLMEIAKEAMKR